MSMVAFFPWLQIRQPVQIASFRMFMYHGGKPLPDGVTSTVTPENLERLLTPFRVQAQLPVRAHCLLQIGDRPVGEDLDVGEQATVFRFARHLAVAGLATRRFDGSPLGSYSASGHYQVIVQQFPTPFTGSVVSSHRRKDGETRVLISPGSQNFQIPEHLVSQVQPTIDWALLLALEAAHAGLDAARWGPYQASITQFLMANSDSPDVPLDAESIATYAALERLVGSDKNKQVFLNRVLACLAEVDAQDWARELRSKLMPGREARDVVSNWLKALYILRGNAGHGYPIAKIGNAAWSQNEHLLAGAFVYPLALKCKLHQVGYYRLTSEDVAHVVGLDRLLGDRPFFAPVVQDGLSEGGLPIRGWPRQMEVLGEAWTARELSRCLGDAYEEAMNRT